MGNPAYEELLCYQGFEVGVDQLLRAYLDTRLVEMTDDNDYDTQAGTLRNQLLTGHFLEAARSWDYLYWFDIRAAFWKRREITAETRALIIPSAKLLSLYNAARAQQAKLSTATPEHPSRDVLLFLAELTDCAHKPRRPNTLVRHSGRARPSR
jgi:hypothetical protein